MKNCKTVLTAYLIIFVLGLSFTSCKQTNRQQEQLEDDIKMETATEDNAQKIYRAQISSLNENANQNRNVSGTVTLEVEGDQLEVVVEASGLEPNMMHLQHLHGSQEGEDTGCPDVEADKNNDGFVDITEAYDVAGVTMIPFHDNPTNMEVDTQTYPIADEDGNISYRQTVDLNELRDAFNEKFDREEDEELDFSQFTFLIHGVQENAVRGTVQSVKGLPSHVTLPVGCAKLE